MNLEELLAALREKLDDETQPYLWEDATLVRKLNNAVREACIRARLLRGDEQTCPELCRIPLNAGQAYVTHADEILVVRSGRLASNNRKLWALTAESMDDYRCDWQADTNTGVPEVMVMDLAQKTLRLVPTPTANDTLYLRVWRMPRKQERMCLDQLGKGPVIKIPDVEELCHWAAYEAFMKPDTETENKQRAADELALFEKRFGSRPSLHEMARWADSPPRIRRAMMF